MSFCKESARLSRALSLQSPTWKRNSCQCWQIKVTVIVSFSRESSVFPKCYLNLTPKASTSRRSRPQMFKSCWKDGIKYHRSVYGSSWKSYAQSPSSEVLLGRVHEKTKLKFWESYMISRSTLQKCNYWWSWYLWAVIKWKNMSGGIPADAKLWMACYIASVGCSHLHCWYIPVLENWHCTGVCALSMIPKWQTDGCLQRRYEPTEP